VEKGRLGDDAGGRGVGGTDDLGPRCPDDLGHGTVHAASRYALQSSGPESRGCRESPMIADAGKNSRLRTRAAGEGTPRHARRGIEAKWNNNPRIMPYGAGATRHPRPAPHARRKTARRCERGATPCGAASPPRNRVTYVRDARRMHASLNETNCSDLD